LSKEDLFRKSFHVGSIAESDPIDELAPDVSKDVRQVLQTVKGKDVEIERWFQHNPDQILRLRKEPERVISDIVSDLGLETPYEIKPIDIGPWEPIVKPRTSTVGIALLTRVWDYVANSPQNTEEFMSNPFGIIRQVGSNTNASKEEIDAVIAAFERVFGIYRVDLDELSMFGKVTNGFSSPEVGSRWTS
jgi:hypothetical protein